MEIIFIPTYYKISDLKNFENLIKKLPKKISLVYIKQYEFIAKKILEELEKKGFEIIKKEGLYGLTVLGCYSEPANTDADIILLIGNGKFHAKNISRMYNKRVIVYDPITGNIEEIFENIDNKIKILLYKLKESKNIGFLISIKPGQYYINEALKMKKVLENDNKNVYLFLTNEINFNQILNFPYIDFWVIFACPRLIDDILENNINAITFDYLFKYY